MDFPNNYFKDKSPAEIVAKVATITLANISLLGASELRRIGWLDNPVIDILYSLTSTGVWIARTDTSGRVTDAYTSSIATRVQAIGKFTVGPTVNDLSSTLDTTAVATNAMRRRAQIPLTEAGGAIAATVIVTGIATYKARCIIRKIWAPTGTTDAANTWNVTSEAGGGITGPASFGMNITALRNHWADAGAAGVSGDGILVYQTTADKDILLDAADLANVGTTYYVEVEYWYEA